MGIMIDEYTIACGPTVTDLVLHVEELIKEGWQPQGGIAVCPYDDVDMHFQAMVMYADDE